MHTQCQSYVFKPRHNEKVGKHTLWALLPYPAKRCYPDHPIWSTLPTFKKAKKYVYMYNLKP